MTEPDRQAAPTSPNWRLWLTRGLMLAFVIGLSVFIYSIKDQAATLAAFGYPGVFLLSILANATVVLPAPGLVLVFGAPALGLNPWIVGIVAGVGATIGEFSGYIAGYSGSAAVENRDMYDRLHRYILRYGPWVLTVLGFLPLPFFDLAGIVAGVLKLPVHEYFIFTLLGKAPKMTIIALAGAGALSWAPWLNQVISQYIGQ
ncbi:MAG: VTT domain-containing protein [Anaerolineales bacterium]|nr:VTT domain-containing protein [Anaerolineales bacterium]